MRGAPRPANQLSFQQLLDEFTGISNSLFLTEAYLSTLDAFTDHLEDVGASATDLYRSLTTTRQHVLTFTQSLERRKRHLEIRMRHMVQPHAEDAEEVN